MLLSDVGLAYYDHTGKLIANTRILFSKACELSLEHPEKLLVVCYADNSDFNITLDELVKNCRFVVHGGVAFFVSDNKSEDKRNWIFKDNIQCEVVNRQFAKDLIKKFHVNKPKTDPEVVISKQDTVTCKNDESVVERKKVVFNNALVQVIAKFLATKHGEDFNECFEVLKTNNLVLIANAVSSLARKQPAYAESCLKFAIELRKIAFKETYQKETEVAAEALNSN